MCYSAMVSQNLATLLTQFKATKDEHAFQQYTRLLKYGANATKEDLKKTLGLARKPSSPLFRWAPHEMQRLYPNYFAPVMILQEGQRTFVPMRYRLRPADTATEIPTKYNVFNARLDSLKTRPTWQRLFARERHHALFPFCRFYEWVQRGKRKVEISFSPENYELMWAPALYDQWVSEDGRIAFSSFAMITDEPPREIAAAGHDRCPIFLDHQVIDDWLAPEAYTEKDLLDILACRQPVHYHHELAV